MMLMLGTLLVAGFLLYPALMLHAIVSVLSALGRLVVDSVALLFAWL